MIFLGNNLSFKFLLIVLKFSYYFSLETYIQYNNSSPSTHTYGSLSEIFNNINIYYSNITDININIIDDFTENINFSTICKQNIKILPNNTNEKSEIMQITDIFIEIWSNFSIYNVIFNGMGENIRISFDLKENSSFYCQVNYIWCFSRKLNKI